VLAIACYACNPDKQTAYQLQHLDHLYEQIPLDEKIAGAVWIYCEAPDYRLIADDDEGFTCVDDVARALVLLCRDYSQVADPALLESRG